MNIKADKIALDNKVNMSTFDERYQMLEHALQQTLDRLDEYAAQVGLCVGECVCVCVCQWVSVFLCVSVAVGVCVCERYHTGRSYIFS